MADLVNRALPPAACVKSDAHGNVINVDQGTITFAGHPRAVALAGFVLVAVFWVGTLACLFWGSRKLPPVADSHDLRRNKYRSFAVFWFLLYLTADAALRFLQYHVYTFPVEVMFTELARVKPQGLAEYFFFVTILRCEDVFVIGRFDHLNRWKYMRLVFLFLLTLVDLIGSGADYYYRISLVMKVAEIVGKNVSADDCLSYSIYAQLKTYADIIFYSFSLVCCLFFTIIVAKFKTRGSDSTVQKYKMGYMVVVAAFWIHCIQCLIGTLVFDQFNANETQTIELIYVLIYDATILVLLVFLIKLKKLEIDPKQCNYSNPTEFAQTTNEYGAMPAQSPPVSDYSTMPSWRTASAAQTDFGVTKYPTNMTTAYTPVSHF